jgi:hypothetical protein
MGLTLIEAAKYETRLEHLAVMSTWIARSLTCRGLRPGLPGAAPPAGIPAMDHRLWATSTWTG